MGLSIIDYKTMIIDGVSCGDGDTQTLLANNIDVLWSMHNKRACHRDLQYLYAQKDAIQLAMDNLRMMIQQGNSNLQAVTTNVFDAHNERDQQSQESQQAFRKQTGNESDNAQSELISDHQANRDTLSDMNSSNQHISPYQTNGKDLSTQSFSYSGDGDSTLQRQFVIRGRDELDVDGRHAQYSNEHRYAVGGMDLAWIDKDIDAPNNYLPSNLDTIREMLAYKNIALPPPPITLQSIFADAKIGFLGQVVSIATRIDDRRSGDIKDSQGYVRDSDGNRMFAPFDSELTLYPLQGNPPYTDFKTETGFHTRVSSPQYNSVFEPLPENPATNFDKTRDFFSGTGDGATIHNVHRDALTTSSLTADASMSASASDVMTSNSLAQLDALMQGEQGLTAQHTSDGTTHAIAHGVGVFNSTLNATVKYLNQLFDNLNQMYHDVLKEIELFEREIRGGSYSLKFMWVKFPQYNFCAATGNNQVLRGVPCNVSVGQGNAFTLQQMQPSPTLPSGGGSTVIVASPIHYEVPSGTINGSNASFLLTLTPIPSISLMLYKNGVLQKIGAANDFVLVGRTIVFAASAIPIAGDVLFASYEA